MKLQDYIAKLNELGAYDQFANNLKATSSLTIEEYYGTGKENQNGSFKSFLSCAFAWYFTPEGHNFWSKIANS